MLTKENKKLFDFDKHQSQEVICFIGRVIDEGNATFA